MKFDIKSYIRDSNASERAEVIDALLDVCGNSLLLSEVARMMSERPDCERKIQIKMAQFIREMVKEAVW
jgi:hypothetical protein